MELTPVVDNSQDDIGIKASVASGLRDLVHAAGVQATEEIFTENMLPEAKDLSPVGTAPEDPHPGLNRDSIAVSFRDDPEEGWISAWLFTKSGYGWLIEHGTSHNRALTRKAKSDRRTPVFNDRTAARPYIYPAIMNHAEEIADRQREILEAL